MKVLVESHKLWILDRYCTIPAVAACSCGHLLDLDDDVNRCICGKAYNKAGDMILGSEDTSIKQGRNEIGKEREMKLNCETCPYRGSADICRICKIEQMEHAQENQSSVKYPRVQNISPTTEEMQQRGIK